MMRLAIEAMTGFLVLPQDLPAPRQASQTYYEIWKGIVKKAVIGGLMKEIESRKCTPEDLSC